MRGRTNKLKSRDGGLQRAVTDFTLQKLEPRALMTATWLSGVGDGNWNLPGNWDNGLVPVVGEDVVFSSTVTLGDFENVTLATPVMVGLLTFNGDYNLQRASITTIASV